MSDNFGGAWLVTEYVHDPDGTLIGTVSQRRLVEPADAGRLRITQICQPSDELADHPMGAFAGEWVFELEVHGNHRHYLGPDVIGLGTQWRPGAMTGAGLWPRFGYEFESYGVLVAPDRQLTGGFFSFAGRSVCDIVGIAVPESLGIEPLLDLKALPPKLDQALALQRDIGPMRIGSGQPTATHRRRVWAMNDALGDTVISITEDRHADQVPIVTIVID